nr:hypothetical protein [Rhodococcus sp. 06-1059B-a]
MPPPAQACSDTVLLDGPGHLPRAIDAAIGRHSVSDCGVISIESTSVPVGRAHAGMKGTVLRRRRKT